MEILNQYMNNWVGFHVSYTLNTMYYYIYQSFLLQPPVKISQLAPAPGKKLLLMFRAEAEDSTTSCSSSSEAV